MLASADRTGRYAKSKALKLNAQFARRRWRPLAFICVVPVGAMPIVIVTSEGTWRGVQIGVLAMIGPWIASLGVLLYSGAATASMSVAAEESTAADLRRLKGWRLINDLYINEQVDHVAVGPGGLIVVETKAAADPWDRNDMFMADRLRRGLEQARRSRRKVETWQRGVLRDAPVYGALVLWSPQGAPGMETDPPQPGDVSVVPAADFGRWLADLPGSQMDSETVNAVWSALVEHVRKRDAWSHEHNGPPHRPMMSRLIRSVLVPMLAALAALYLAAATAGWSFWLLVCELVAGVVAGRLRHHTTLGPAAVGWAAANALMLVTLTVSVGVALLR